MYLINKRPQYLFPKALSAVLIFMLSCIYGFFGVQAFAESGPLRIESVLFNSADRTISLVVDNNQQFGSEYQTVKLSQPDRMIIDIPNAILSTPTRMFPIQESGINRVELSQTLGTFYQVVRITIVADSHRALENMKITPSGNRLKVTLANGADRAAEMEQPPLPPQHKSFSFLDNPIPSNMSVLKKASFENGTLFLTADNGQPLVVKNQFTLTSPKRLVVDLANTVLASKSLTVPIDIRSGPIRTIRLGQFDDQTVRIVVETSRPNGLYMIYPGEDKSQLALSPTLTHSIGTLPVESQTVGFIEDINLEKRDETSIIKLRTTDPMVRNVARRGNRIEVALENIAAKPSFVAYDKQAYANIKEIRLSPLNAKEPNTKMIIELENSNVDMESRLSFDGRYLEITLSPRGGYSRSHETAKLPEFVMPKIRKGAYTVVVDAGHGGKDLGANRSGVYEKYLNLSVALKVKKALEAKGVTVYMTRSTDTFLELSQITGITNRISPDAFVSVHTNASVNSSANGLETYYFTPQSRRLAQLVHRRLVNSVNSPDRGVRTARFYVIHHTRVPAILCEMGYISNPSEREALQSEHRQRATAEAIAQGVVEFLGQRFTARPNKEKTSDSGG